MSAILLSLQIGGPFLRLLLQKQPLTRSLLSRSEASRSRTSHSIEGSYFAIPYSKPYVLCSATDAASAAIDFLKGNVEEGVVDSPPSHGVPRTPICSPFPLKRIASTPSRMRSQSPTERTEFTPNRKLYTDDIVEAVDPHVDGAVPLLPIVGHPLLQSAKLKAMSLNVDQKRKAQVEGGQCSHLVPTMSLPSKSILMKFVPAVVPINRRKNLGDCRRSDGLPFNGIAIPNIGTGNRPQLGYLPRGCRSLSNTGLSRGDCKRYREEANQFQNSGMFGPVLSASAYSRPSRREDILREYAKMKALEAANSSSSTKHKS